MNRLRNFWVRNIRFLFRRNGFGVHSPFVFYLITQVVRNTYSYYFYKDYHLALRKLYYDRHSVIKGINLLPQDILDKQTLQTKDAKFLFRLANALHLKEIAVVGSYAGCASACLSAYSQFSHTLTYEPMETHLALAKKLNKSLGIEHTTWILTDFSDVYTQFSKVKKNVDCIFLGDACPLAIKQELVDLCLDHLSPKGVLIMEGIEKDKAHRTFWKNIQQKKKVTVSLNIFTMGLVFIDAHLNKKNYIIGF